MKRCLTLMEISSVADFIMDPEWDEPAAGLIDHVIECPKCQLEVVELVEICSSSDEDDEVEDEEIYMVDQELLLKYWLCYLNWKKR